MEELSPTYSFEFSSYLVLVGINAHIGPHEVKSLKAMEVGTSTFMNPITFMEAGYWEYGFFNVTTYGLHPALAPPLVFLDSSPHRANLDVVTPTSRGISSSAYIPKLNALVYDPYRWATFGSPYSSRQSSQGVEVSCFCHAALQCVLVFKPCTTFKGAASSDGNRPLAHRIPLPHRSPQITPVTRRVARRACHLKRRQCAMAAPRCRGDAIRPRGLSISPSRRIPSPAPASLDLRLVVVYPHVEPPSPRFRTLSYAPNIFLARLSADPDEERDISLVLLRDARLAAMDVSAGFSYLCRQTQHCRLRVENACDEIISNNLGESNITNHLFIAAHVVGHIHPEKGRQTQAAAAPRLPSHPGGYMRPKLDDSFCRIRVQSATLLLHLALSNFHIVPNEPGRTCALPIIFDYCSNENRVFENG
ncbi:hypothetical protein PLEOSDRAFT_156288 [Pleurotus ostreatus PC15]|uniref:Uncharacterized protein n=1 Tax=Pleurotus ostreatus (strain PC15) TaxID=1137138 RepID=A0A067NY41_PLEO1|nr:hypothetical protein PLEOSDRAFT_156288 [Pleurotus ostreatus PC15]